MTMLTPEELQSLKERIVSFRDDVHLPEEDVLVDLLDATVTTLENEDSSYRPAARNGKPGGLLDFISSDIPVIIVPDLHARPDFLINVLNCMLGDETVLSALNGGRVTVVCVGDGVHTENTSWAYARWKQSLLEWQEGKMDGDGMRAEMHEGFATMMAVWTLKNAFPRHFHFLKGNHENILNREGGGDHPFRKFAFEGEMVKNFVSTVYSDVLLHLIHCFETALPVVAVFSTFGISHAEPQRAYSRKQIINYHEDPQLILHFTWTANGEAEEGSVRAQFEALNASSDLCADDLQPLWFGGHRPVDNTCLLRQDGQFVQIHNPCAMNVAFVIPGEMFNPDEDIIPVIKQ